MSLSSERIERLLLKSLALGLVGKGAAILMVARSRAWPDSPVWRESALPPLTAAIGTWCKRSLPPVNVPSSVAEPR